MTERDNVTVFEDTIRQTLERFKPNEDLVRYYNGIEPVPADVITCPAPSARMDKEKARKIFTSRIEQIVLSAIANEAECIVLGAWGCGAFGQDPALVANSFATVLNKYSGYFREVVFAIKPTPHWGEADLYSTFVSEFNTSYKGKVREYNG